MIDFKRLLKERDISILTLSKILNISYASLYDIINQNVKIEDCKFLTVQKIAAFFRIDLNHIYLQEESFQNFRNNLHHEIIHNELLLYKSVIHNNSIEKYLLHSEIEKAVYLMALIEYIEHKYKMEMSETTKQYKKYALKNPLIIQSDIFNDDKYIPEFKERNIMEGDLYDALWRNMTQYDTGELGDE